MKNLLEIFNKIGVHKNNGLFITSENKWQKACLYSNRIERLIANKLNPDAFFCFDSKPLILFYENPRNVENIHKAIWNFNESPIVIIAENDKVEIFNGFKYINDESSLKLIGNKEILNDFRYFEIVTGKVWEKYEANLSYTNRVDFHLLKNLKSASKTLKDNGLEQQIINALIGKVIFVRYLIDRKVKIGYGGENKYWSNDDFCSVLSNRENAIQFFKYLEDKFNGDMFLLDSKDYELITPGCLNVIIKLLNEDDLGSGQQSLFKLYDFSIIPIEFISNIYESFIGEENQEKESAYYTPLFLVDYILKETVGNYLTNNPSEYNCKVLDPACGSGIFLVETLRKIIEQFIELNPQIKEDTDEFKEAIKNLAINNIYGVDKNLSAIQVAIFSIQLTLLDYQKPSSVETFKFPPLLNTNFFEADFFNTDHEFNSLFEELEFSFIIGNPPWKGNGMDSIGKLYLKNRKKEEGKKEFPIAVNNGEIAEGFVLRVSDFSNINTKISLIVRSSILYNLGYKTNYSAFRKYWLEEFQVKKVFELAPVRKEVFDKSNDPSVAPSAVLFYQYAHGENTDKNTIEHLTLKPNRFFSLFKIFSLNRNDIKKVEQKKLKDDDWLWKTLVYGSYLDYNFIKSLKLNNATIKDVIYDNDKFVVSTGIHTRSFVQQQTKDTSYIDNLPLLRPNSIQSMFIDYDKTGILESKKVDIVKDVRIYKSPMLLIREGLKIATLTAKSAISKKDVVFKDSITSIKAINHSDVGLLRQINAIYASSLFSYLAINTFSSIGIERERAKNYNKFSVPFIDCDTAQLVVDIEKLNEQIHKEKQLVPINNIIVEILEKKVQKNLKIIDKEIFKTLSLNEKELALIDYALNINRPIITKDKNSVKKLFQPMFINDKILEDYAKLFIDRFKQNIDSKTQKFIVEIWHSKQIVGMFFKVVPNAAENTNNIVWIDKSKDGILPTIMKLTSEKITDKLFVQKDLRGFEKEFFYVFKPNEKRLWHKAIGYLDVEEFMDAILKAGRSGK